MIVPLMRRLLTLLALGASIAAVPAAAAVTDSVKVHDTGGNRMEVFTRALALVFQSPPDYARGCCYDTNGGEWVGPPVVGGPGNSTIDWSYEPRFGEPDNATAARRALIHGAPEVASGATTVPHLIGSRSVGSIAAFYVITRLGALGGNARHEAAVAWPIHPGIHAVARFDLLNPVADPASVNGMLASAWNREQAERSLQGVSLVGSLPPRRVTARARGRRVAGRVLDMHGHAVAGAAVRLEQRRGRRWRAISRTRSGATGGFSLRARSAGTYRVTATLVISARSARVRVR
jgi:Carboxypeptidase regulatory-like domain